MNNLSKIGFGGGCHWCTEAVFKSLKGVEKVEQGFMATDKQTKDFSEAVIVYFHPENINLNDLIAIHLHTHQSTKNHSMRSKYRSAIYFFEAEQERLARQCLTDMQSDFSESLITKVLPFGEFTPSEERFQDYYFKDKGKPFCKRHISPKIGLLMRQFSEYFDVSTL